MGNPAVAAFCNALQESAQQARKTARAEGLSSARIEARMLLDIRRIGTRGILIGADLTTLPALSAAVQAELGADWRLDSTTESVGSIEIIATLENREEG